jgi:hypothetical protein
METSQLKKDLSGLIEWKINERNRLSKMNPKPVGIIQIIDREIDILEKVELYYEFVNKKHPQQLIDCQRKYFNKGILSGKMEQLTGRPHHEYFF